MSEQVMDIKKLGHARAKIFWGILVSMLIGLLYYPKMAFACKTIDDCNMTPNTGCIAASKSCDNGVCNYSWSCTDMCRGGWTAWSPDPCTIGDYQRRDCLSGDFAYQLKKCGAGGGGGGNRQYSYGPNCAANEVRSDTVIGTNLGGQCGKGRNWQSGTIYSLGTAEQSPATDANCCNMAKTSPKTCGDWYSCPTPNNPSKMCRDCVDEVVECVGHNVFEYQCVSNCDDTAPTGLSVSNIHSTSATIQWTPGTNGTTQRVYVDEDLSDVDASCPTLGDCEGNVTGLTTMDTSEIVAGLLPNTLYHVRVVTYSDASCSADVHTTFTTPDNQVSGYVYLDTNNTCDISTIMSGQTVTLDSTTSTVSGVSGNYAFIADTVSSHSLAIAIPSGYVCSTGIGCANTCTKTGVISPSSNNHFYLTQNRASWWQVEGGKVYAGSNAGGDVVRSTIPSSVTALNRYLVIPGTTASAAVIRASGNAPSLGDGSVNSNGWSAKSQYRGDRADYSYFVKELGLTSTTPANLQNLNAKPDIVRDYYLYNGDGTVTGTWSVEASDSYVVFVNGDLNINEEITVANGGFLAFIVNGDITVASNVRNIQGLFVSEGNFVTTPNGATDLTLNVAGSVVAWGTVSLGRDLVANNAVTPAETFTYRPDLIVNMPVSMKTFVMEWSEVVPGTYDLNQ